MCELRHSSVTGKCRSLMALPEPERAARKAGAWGTAHREKASADLPQTGGARQDWEPREVLPFAGEMPSPGSAMPFSCVQGAALGWSTQQEGLLPKALCSPALLVGEAAVNDPVQAHPGCLSSSKGTATPALKNRGLCFAGSGFHLLPTETLWDL